MNKQEIINKIKALFSSKQTFGMYKNKDGVEFRIEKMEVEAEIYVITPEGELPAPDGQIVLEDGTSIKVSEGKIGSLELPVVEEEMDEAVLTDGTKVMTDEGKFEVGKPLFVITQEGDKVPAPEGSHITESGIELVVDAAGVITGVKYPDESGEGSLETMTTATLIDGTIVENDSEELKVGDELFVLTEQGRQAAPDGEHETTEGKIVVVVEGKIVEIKEKSEVETEEMMEVFSNALVELKNKINELETENKILKEKFNKFSKEPAAEKIYDRKGFSAYQEQEMFSKLERLAALKKLTK